MVLGLWVDFDGLVLDGRRIVEGLRSLDGAELVQLSVQCSKGHAHIGQLPVEGLNDDEKVAVRSNLISGNKKRSLTSRQSFMALACNKKKVAVIN